MLTATQEVADDELMQLLDAWLPSRRWFPAKGRSAELTCLGGLTLTDPLGAARVRVLLVRAVAPGVDTVLQVPLTIVPADPNEQVSGSLIGTIGEPAVQVHDGPGEPAFLRAWLAAADGPGTDVDVDRARVLTSEQSNTSVVLPAAPGGTEAGILKVFRALSPGHNPDVDVPRALAGAGWEHVPRPLAWLDARWPSPDGSVQGHLGVLSAFVPDAQDGFELACVRAGAGVSFAVEARDLGEVVAGMHAALARALPVPATGSGRERADALASAVRDRYAWAVALVPELSSYAERVETLAGSAAALRDLPAPQRVHGDLHLGQVLRSGSNWYVTDFEGEPQAPIAARTRPDLALRDVAGMLRSLDYAAAVGGAKPPAPGGHDWADEARQAFLDGYLTAARSLDAPGSAMTDRSVVLRALELDKALYEAVYESRNRPGWLPIPLGALDRLLAQAAAADVPPS